MHAVIGKNCIIGANALIPEGKVIPDNSVVMGSPGKIVKTLDQAAEVKLKMSAMHYAEHFKNFQHFFQTGACHRQAALPVLRTVLKMPIREEKLLP